MGASTTCRRLRPVSPILGRSRSGASSISLPETSPSTTATASNANRKVITRSQSATRSSRTLKSATNEEAVKRTTVPRSQGGANGALDPLSRFLQRGSPRNSTSMMRPVKSPTPSAWALSPGRSSPCATPPASPAGLRAKSGGGGGVSGVLKYFKQKKASLVQEEDYHRFRVLYNRLIHWRFVNARAEVAMNNVKIKAEDKLFMVWLRILKMRKMVTEERIQAQKLRQELKLRRSLGRQLPNLIEWSRMDAKNHEALSRVARKLHALSVRVPFVDGGKADIMSMYEAMKTAVEVLDSIEEIISEYQSQVEINLYLLTELTSMMDLRMVCYDEVERSLASLPTLLARENSLRAHLIQAATTDSSSI